MREVMWWFQLKSYIADCVNIHVCWEFCILLLHYELLLTLACLLMSEISAMHRSCIFCMS